MGLNNKIHMCGDFKNYTTNGKNMERKQRDNTQTKENLRAVLNTSKDDNFTFIENIINNYYKTMIY